MSDKLRIVIFLIIILILVILVVIKLMEPKKRYLNYNSTYMTGGRYNPSDNAYPETMELSSTEEYIKEYIAKYVNCKGNCKVIFTSGATEAIANCIFWAKSYNKYGTIAGSRLDHDAVKLNSENMYLNYKEIEIDNEKIVLPKNTSMVFITHVCPKTGEIYPVNKIPKQKYLSENHYDDDYSKEAAQYKPLRVADITQSIGKIKIDMDDLDLNAVFFSLHKLSGDYNCGVLVVKDSTDYPFKPLIAGHQQRGMRGGTYNSYSYLSLPKLIKAYESDYDYSSCKNAWENAVKELKAAKIDVVEPKLNHTYNTILIKRKGCSLGLIHELAEKGIYIGASTACNTKNKDTFIRISFVNGNQLKSKTLKKIIDTIKLYDKDNDLDDVEFEEEPKKEMTSSYNQDFELEDDMDQFI